MKTALIAGLALVLLLPGCVQAPQDLFVVTAEQRARQQTETRRYEGLKENELLAAAASVLQDLGYTLDHTEPRLGLITASKQRGADQQGLQLGLSLGVGILSAVFGNGRGNVNMPVDRQQEIRVSLVARPVLDQRHQPLDRQHLVRVTFQREILRSDGSTRAETLNDPALYQDFHARLSKSVFLEAQKL